MRTITSTILAGILLLVVLNSTVMGAKVKPMTPTLHWTGAGGDSNWNNPKNWDLGRVPKFEDEIIIDKPKAPQPRFTAQDTIPQPIVFITVGYDANSGSLDIEGGNLECNCGMVGGKVPRRKVGPGGNAVVNMKGGTLKFLGVSTMGDPICMGGSMQWPRANSTAVFNMSGGTLDLSTLQIPAADFNSSGTFNLDGGVVNVRLPSNPGGGLCIGENMYRDTKMEGGVMNITGGKLILEGDMNKLINKYVNDMKVLVPYPAASDAAFHKYVVVDYDIRNDGKTTVTAVKNDIKQAYKPEPFDGNPFAGKTVTLGWSAGAGAVKHDVYLCTCPETIKSAADPNTAPGKGRQNANSYKPEGLESGKTYYWRIDGVDGTGNVAKGDIWSFTVGEKVKKPADPNKPAEPNKPAQQ